MTAEKKTADEDVIPCKRTGESFDPKIHLRCPYCFGGEAEVRSGEREGFCDFNPEKDPVSFGFPRDSSRAQHG